MTCSFSSFVHFVASFSVPAGPSAQHRCCPWTQVSGHSWPRGCLHQAGDVKCSALHFWWCFTLSVAGCVTWASSSDVLRPRGPLEASFLFHSCHLAEKRARWTEPCQKVRTNNQIFIIIVITLAGYLLWSKDIYDSISKKSDTLATLKGKYQIISFINGICLGERL